MFKSLLATCLVAAANAEADAYYGHGYGLPYAHHALAYSHVPFGSPSGQDPITQGLDASTQGLVHHGHGYHYGKRSADAQVVAHHGLVYAGVPFGSSTGLDPITQGLDASTQGYLPYAHGYAHGLHGVHGLHYGKRSADAQVVAHHGLVYAGVPFGSSTGLDPITQGLDASTQGYLPYAHGYAHGLHGVHGLHYGKRSADAQVIAHHGLVYAGVPFGSSTGLDPITQGLDASTQGYLPYAHGYAHGLHGVHGLHYGKRSAQYAHHGLVYAGVPFGSSTGLDPLTQGLDASTQGYLPYAHHGHHGVYYG